MDAGEARTIGRRLRRIREARGKPLVVIAEMSGMSIAARRRTLPASDTIGVAKVKIRNAPRAVITGVANSQVQIAARWSPARRGVRG